MPDHTLLLLFMVVAAGLAAGLEAKSNGADVLVIESGEVLIPGDVEIDLTKIKIPAYFISAIEDHIAPCASTRSFQLGRQARSVASSASA